MTTEGWAVVIADVVAVLVFIWTRQPAHALPRAKLHALRRGRYELKR